MNTPLEQIPGSESMYEVIFEEFSKAQKEMKEQQYRKEITVLLGLRRSITQRIRTLEEYRSDHWELWETSN